MPRSLDVRWFSGRALLGAALVAASVAAAPARAQDPQFPPASRIGLVPPAGFVVSKTFRGFEHAEKQASIVMAELPAYAFESIEKEVTGELQKGQAVPVSRQEVQLKDGGHGFVLAGRPDGPQGPIWKWTMVAIIKDVTAVVTALVPDAVKEVASDEVVRAAFASLALRSVPPEEQLSVLPFTFADLAGFRIVRVQPGSAIMLTDGSKDAVESTEQPLVVVTLAPGTPPQPADRDRFARQVFTEVPGIKDVRIVRAEPLRIGAYQGHEILVDAKDAKTDTDVAAVQWLRFGTGGYLRIVGVARKDVWPGVFPRLRALRDGIEPR